ncbi:MAG: hypothetical protein KDC52_02560, partial [Ignavibacteriae bacterium]|nr:hypothetical protein [Ignavibacteriota bacterium]
LSITVSRNSILYDDANIDRLVKKIYIEMSFAEFSILVVIAFSLIRFSNTRRVIQQWCQQI